MKLMQGAHRLGEPSQGSLADDLGHRQAELATLVGHAADNLTAHREFFRTA